MMKKEYDKWNKTKKKIHEESLKPFYGEREIWWCSLGVNIGFEQDGTGRNFDRPVVIIRGFSRDIFFCVALTGKKKTGKYYFYIGKVEEREASAILSQVRLVDSKRLIRKVGMLDVKIFAELKERLKNTLFP